MQSAIHYTTLQSDEDRCEIGFDISSVKGVNIKVSHSFLCHFLRCLSVYDLNAHQERNKMLPGVL